MTTPFWYNAALAIIKPLYRWKVKQRAQNLEQYQQECLERFGPFQPVKNQNALWFHCVSVGETNAAQPLIEHYLQLGHAVLVTNTTKTGQARAKTLFLKKPYENLFQAVYLPADQKKLVATFFEKYRPKFLALVETELWPNLIAQAKLAHVPCLLLNARLSEKSAKGYRKVLGLTVPMLHGFNQLLAQDIATAERFIALGADPQITQVVGSIKFDITAPPSFVEQAAKLKQVWQLENRQVILLASTHAPEEKELLSALKSQLEVNSQLVCIVVPRHPERFDEVYLTAQALNLITQRRSLNESIQLETQVYLADSMGEMWLWYALSQVCYVGGSLNEPGGGHNILEPIALNVPTLLGKNYFNFQTIVDEFVTAHAIDVVDTPAQAVDVMIALLNDREKAMCLNTAAQVIMQRNRGSLHKHIQLLDQYL